MDPEKLRDYLCSRIAATPSGLHFLGQPDYADIEQQLLIRWLGDNGIDFKAAIQFMVEQGWISKLTRQIEVKFHTQGPSQHLPATYYRIHAAAVSVASEATPGNRSPNQNDSEKRKQKIRTALKTLPTTKGKARKRLQNKISRWKKVWAVEFAEVH